MEKVVVLCTLNSNFQFNVIAYVAVCAIDKVLQGLWRLKTVIGLNESRSNTWCGPGTMKGSRASRVTTQGDIVVPKLFPKNGPKGTYSQAWISRAMRHKLRDANTLKASLHTTPIIHQDDSEDVLSSTVNRNRFSKFISNSDHKCLWACNQCGKRYILPSILSLENYHFQFKVQLPRWAIDGWTVGVQPKLSLWATNRGSWWHNGWRSTMISNR